MFDREEIIDRLEIMKSHGQFEGYPEEVMNFSDLNNQDLEYYKEWLIGQFDEE